MHLLSGRLTKRGSVVGLVPQRSRSQNQRQLDEQTITGSLSLGGPSVYSSSTSQQQDDRPSKCIEKSSSLFSMPARKDSRKSSTDGLSSAPLSLAPSNTLHNEPQLTPSISNIGGAVLRSKTADFERMLMQNKKSGSGSGEISAPIQTTDTSADSVAASQVKKQPIYKRKELISSVQSSKK